MMKKEHLILQNLVCTLAVIPLTSRKDGKKYDSSSVNIQNIIEKEQKYIKKMENEISKMKKDSIALINQITKYIS